MKKLLLVLGMVVTISLSAQIPDWPQFEITKWTTIGVADKLVGNPKLDKTESGNQYDLYYRNYEYTSLNDMKHLFFNATPEELDYLYNEFASVFTTKSKETKNISVGNATIYYRKQSASIRITIDYDSESGETSGWFFVSKKKLAKLFGKK